MSPIGRIFIVLNLVLAAAFLGWASNALATNSEWKNKHSDLQEEMNTKLAEKDAQLSTLEIEKNQLADERRLRREERDQLKTEKDGLQAQLDEQKRRNDDMQANLTNIQATLGDYNQTIAQLEAAKDRAVEESREMERERNEAVDQAAQAETGRREAVEEKQRADAMIADLEAVRTQLTREVSSLDTELKTLVAVTGVRRDQVSAQPDIRGAVLDVRTDLPPGLVMLNRGSADGVQRGFTFEVYRGSQYKGKVRVENVQENASSALIMLSVPGASIQQGDQAATRL